MSTWYYFDNDGQKQGPYNGGQLKWLAKNGKITPETIVETEDGKKAQARKINGLTFAKSVPSEDLPIADANPFTVSTPVEHRIDNEEFWEFESIDNLESAAVTVTIKRNNKILDSLKDEANSQHCYKLLKGTAGLCETAVGILRIFGILICIGNVIFIVRAFKMDNGILFGTALAALLVNLFSLLLIWILLSAIEAACRWMIHVGRNVHMIREMEYDPSLHSDD